MINNEFDLRLFSFFAAQDRMLCSYFRSEGIVTYGEFTLLYALWDVEQPITIEPLSRFLLLQPRTIRMTILELEEKGLIKKAENPDDRRLSLLTLTDEGLSVLKKSIEDCKLLFENTIWRFLPEEDINDSLKDGMRHNLDGIRGYHVDSFPKEANNYSSFLAVDHFVFWRYCLETWRKLARDDAGISLNEACVLGMLLRENSMESLAVQKSLLFTRTSMSLAKRALLDIGFIEEEYDSRVGSSILRLTAQGEKVAQRTVAALGETIVTLHENCTNAEQDIINAWYTRMFANMWAGYRE